MHVTRFSEANTYDAKGHFNMAAFQLQGGAANETGQLSCGLSQFLPDGGAERSVSPAEKVYVVISGEITVVTDDGEVTLGPMVSCYLGPNEAREIINRSNDVAHMIVALCAPAS